MKAIVFSLLLFPAIASARIGENIDQCRARYGKEISVSPETKSLLFQKGDFSILITFNGGKATTLMISRLFQGNSSSISSAQIESLLSSNGGGSKWKMIKENLLDDKEWITEDGKVLAFSNEKEGTLNIITAAQREANGKEKAKAEAEEIKGF
jgi:hypothetical protein